jgi:hypothetical protein
VPYLALLLAHLEASMPRKKKRPIDWTTKEAMRNLFPKEVVKHVEKLASEGEEPQVKRPKSSTRDKST